jgi:hypothetical protein
MVRKVSEQERLELIAKWRASGEPLHKFAKLQKQSANRLRHLIYRKVKSSNEKSNSLFAKVPLQETTAKQAMFPVKDNSVRIEVSNGVVIEIGDCRKKPFLAAAIFFLAGFAQ